MGTRRVKRDASRKRDAKKEDASPILNCHRGNLYIKATDVSSYYLREQSIAHFFDDDDDDDDDVVRKVPARVM